MKGKIRAKAARILASLTSRSMVLDQLLAVEEPGLSSRDMAMLQELTFGVCRWAPLLEAFVARLLSRPLRQRDRDLQMLLLVGLYQLRFMRVPDHAAVSETVTAAGSLGKGWAKSLVNGVLRQYLSGRDALEASLTVDEKKAHPQWLISSLQQDWPEHAEAMIAANNTRAPMTLRCNTRRVQRETYLTQLRKNGIAAFPTKWSPLGVQLEVPVKTEQLPGFREGLVSVQDEGAQLAALILDPQGGERLLDACAAPGGKTCQLLEIQPAVSELVAVDISAQRLRKVHENLERCQLGATVIEADVSEPGDWWNGQTFDAILADLPCSATGVIRRHPDIKLLRQPDQIVPMQKRQQALLESLWPVLRPGGRLLYSTCSVLRDENDRLIDHFLTRHNDAQAVLIDAPWGVDAKFGRQLLPAVAAHDGFYFALLCKACLTDSLSSRGKNTT